MKITLPWPPTLNNYRHVQRVGKFYRLVTSDAGRAYHKAVAQQVMLEDFGGETFASGPIAVTLTLHPKTNGRFDLDNFAKAILDALGNAGVYRDDSQIDRLEIIRGEKRPGGEAVVEIREVTQ